MSKLIGIITVIILISVLYYFYFRGENIKKYLEDDKISRELLLYDYEELEKCGNNGDLIFLSGKTKGENICKSVANSKYSHVGMLFREISPFTNEDILYIWDSDLGQNTKDGPRVQVLKDKLKLYKGEKICMWRQLSGKRPSTENILEVIKKYMDGEMDKNMLSYFMGIFKEKNKYFCSELIAETLKNLGIMENIKKSYKYLPCHFENNIEGLNMEYEYGLNKFIKF